MTWRKVILIILIIIFIISGVFLYIYIDSGRPKNFSITYFNIGQGDSALIKFENGEKMLVDCGSDRKVLSRLGKALPFYDRTIDYLIATHPDLDHYGGCLDVLRRYDVKNIIINGKEKTYDSYWQEWHRTMLAEPGATIITMASPTTWIIASSTLQFLSPDPLLKLDVGAADSNNFSIVFKLMHDNKTFLFTGDMEVPLENELMKKYCQPSACLGLHADILKVGHHGSDSGTSEAFLGAVQPKQAVISVGKNKFGHPSLRVVRRLERIGAKILRTDQIGDIVME